MGPVIFVPSEWVQLFLCLCMGPVIFVPMNGSSVQSRLCHSHDFCLSGTIEMVNWAKSGALLSYLLRLSR